MPISVVMPALELAQDTGKVLSWRKKEGERVAKGETLLEIETDKAVVEIESPGDGILSGVSAREGAVVPVGQTIAWLVQPGEPVPSASQDRTIAMESVDTAVARASDNRAIASATPAARLSSDTADAGEPGRPTAAIRISPKARRLAQECGVDVTTISGSGPGGEILADDVLRASQQAATAGRQSGLSTIARLMAERTTQSWTTVPHFFLVRDVDATALEAARRADADITVTDLLVAIVGRALRAHPRMNACWALDGTVQMNADVNVAIAIAVEEGVAAGVIAHADRLSVREIAERRKELADRARAGRLQPADIAGGTFTISNLGMYRVDAFTAIIVPPQAGILAVGALADCVVAVEGKPVVRPMVTLTLSCDHRVIDGARGATFLDDVAREIADFRLQISD
jgi:pyruvate dehydrogenase E2 component (dihydrolipoamide acetyltransferase)